MGLEIAAALAIGGAVAGGVGTATQIYGQNMQTKATKKAEALRKQQMDLDSLMKQRAIRRDLQKARSMALATTTAQGAGNDDSSLFGAYGQAQGLAGEQSSYQYENQQIGTGLFEANAQNSIGMGISSTGKSIVGFGQDLVGSSNKIGQLFQTGYDSSWGNTTTSFET